MGFSVFLFITAKEKSNFVAVYIDQKSFFTPTSKIVFAILCILGILFIVYVDEKYCTL